MNIPVLVERVNTNGYQAKSGEPFALTAEGATEDEALHNLEHAIRERMSGGAKVLQLEVGSMEQPWKAFGGWLRDDPLFDLWQEAIAEYRREIDEGPDIL